MFITFEGIDGSGKSTQAALLADWLSEKYKKEVVLTREPGDWDGGSVLRSIVQGGGLRHKWSEAFLFMLDRCEHVERVILPALSEGRIVICDRYHDSTLAYQVWGRGLPLMFFDALPGMAGFPVPDATLFYDIPVETALERARTRSIPDAFEKEGVSFMRKIRDGYVTMAEREPKRWITIDCPDCGVEDVFKITLASLRERGFFRDGQR